MITEKGLNNLQAIASLISGYDHETENSCNDEWYYDKSSKEEKLAYIIEVSESAEGVMPVSILESELIYDFLESDFEGTSDRWFAYMGLGY